MKKSLFRLYEPTKDVVSQHNAPLDNFAAHHSSASQCSAQNVTQYVPSYLKPLIFNPMNA